MFYFILYYDVVDITGAGTDTGHVNCNFFVCFSMYGTGKSDDFPFGLKLKLIPCFF